MKTLKSASKITKTGTRANLEKLGKSNLKAAVNKIVLPARKRQLGSMKGLISIPDKVWKEDLKLTIKK
jgi:hypothetical protein